MNRFLFALAIGMLAIIFAISIWMLTFEMEKAQARAYKNTPTFFLRNHLPDAIGVEYFKRTIQEDEVVTCYWVMGAKDQVLFHTCKQRSLYD